MSQRVKRALRFLFLTLALFFAWLTIAVLTYVDDAQVEAKMDRLR